MNLGNKWIKFLPLYINLFFLNFPKMKSCFNWLVLKRKYFHWISMHEKKDSLELFVATYLKIDCPFAVTITIRIGVWRGDPFFFSLYLRPRQMHGCIFHRSLFRTSYRKITVELNVKCRPLTLKFVARIWAFWTATDLSFLLIRLNSAMHVYFEFRPYL